MPWNIKNKNAVLNSYVGAKILICKFFSVYVDEFEPLISQVNMMEISHSGIMFTSDITGSNPSPYTLKKLIN